MLKMAYYLTMKMMSENQMKINLAYIYSLLQRHFKICPSMIASASMIRTFHTTTLQSMNHSCPWTLDLKKEICMLS